LPNVQIGSLYALKIFNARWISSTLAGATAAEGSNSPSASGE
jgi:hypothetical protein